jgi:hypothetical protein
LSHCEGSEDPRKKTWQTGHACKLGNECSGVVLMIERLVSQKMISDETSADRWLGKNEER